MKIRGCRWRDPHPSDFKPRPYQRDGCDATIAGWRRSIENPTRFGHQRRMCAALATGLGKTHLMAMVAEAAGNQGLVDHVVVAAHQEHLVRGAYEKFVKHFPKLDVGCQMGSKYRIFGNHITVVSVDSMKGKRLRRLLKRLEGKRVALMLDEMHHITEDNKWGVFLARMEEAIPDLLFLGVSATVERTDKVPFGWLLEDESCVAVQVDIRDGTEMGFLAPIRLFAVNFVVDSDQIDVDDDGKNTASSIDRIVNLPESREQFYQRWTELCPDRQMVAFCSDIQAAVEWSAFFESKGVSSTWVASNTKENPLDPKEKQRRIDAFKAGKVQVLCNPYMLTEGFDHAALGAVALLGACKSSVRLTQMVGRGTRVIGYDINTSREAGKEDCIVLDAVGAAAAGLVRQVDLRTAKDREAGEEGDDEETEGGQAPPKEFKTETIAGSEVFELDIYTGAAAVRWKGMRVVPLSEGRVAVVLPGANGGHLCIYAEMGKGVFPQLFDRVDQALDYMTDHLHAGSDTWLISAEDRDNAKKGRPSILTERINRVQLAEMDALAAELDIDHGIHTAPGEALWRAVTYGMGMLLELRSWLALNGPWEPLYGELKAVYERVVGG